MPVPLQRFVWFIIRDMILLLEGVNIVDVKCTRVTHHVKYEVHSVKTDSFVCQNTFLCAIEICGNFKLISLCLKTSKQNLHGYCKQFLYLRKSLFIGLNLLKVLSCYFLTHDDCSDL